MKRGYADGPYGLVHFQDTGSGRPLILLHQAPMTSRQFDSVYPILADRGIRAIGVDTPGFGMSDPTDFVPTIEDWAKVVPPVLDQLGIQQADVLGHHTGSLIATEVEQQFPERVRNLIINGPVPLEEEERQGYLDRVEEREINFVYEPDGSHLQDLFTTRYEYYGAGADPKLITRYVVEQMMGLAPFWYGHNAAFRYDHIASLKKIRQRTLILTNTGDMIYENAKRTHEIRPDFDFAELEGGGADIIDQQSEAWVDAVVEFLGD